MSEKSDAETLKSILNTMDVPSYRMEDYGWLARNLGVRNSKHPKYNDAMKLLKNLIGNTMRKKDIKKIFGE